MFLHPFGNFHKTAMLSRWPGEHDKHDKSDHPVQFLFLTSDPTAS